MLFNGKKLYNVQALAAQDSEWMGDGITPAAAQRNEQMIGLWKSNQQVMLSFIQTLLSPKYFLQVALPEDRPRLRTIHEKVEVELQQLVEEGMLELVQFTDWRHRYRRYFERIE